MKANRRFFISVLSCLFICVLVISFVFNETGV